MPDYKLVWHINTMHPYNFVKKNDFPFKPIKHDKAICFSYYAFEDGMNYLNYCLISNKNEAAFLIPEYKKLDYICFISGTNPEKFVHIFKEGVKKIKNVALAMELDKKKIKGFRLLINDLELFKLNKYKG